MAAVTICSDFGALKNKVSHCFHCFLAYWVVTAVTFQSLLRSAGLSCCGAGAPGRTGSMVWVHRLSRPMACRIFHNQGLEPLSFAWQGRFLTTGPPGKPTLLLLTRVICVFFFFLSLATGLCCLVAKSCLTLLGHHRLQPARLLCPWDFLGKNSGVGCTSFTRGPSRPRDQTLTSCIGRRFFTNEPPGRTGSRPTDFLDFF